MRRTPGYAAQPAVQLQQNPSRDSYQTLEYFQSISVSRLTLAEGIVLDFEPRFPPAGTVRQSPRRCVLCREKPASAGFSPVAGLRRTRRALSPAGYLSRRGRAQ